MAFQYLIDGYNLLFALPEMPQGNWQAKREQLLSYLLTHKLQGNNALSVIFDSRQGLGDEQRLQDMRVIYTAGETADERIINMVRNAANPRLFVVVSNDQGIRQQIRGTGARFISATEFLKTAVARRPASPPPDTAPAESDAITEEFRKKWL